jgi:predicted acylesterase/phospholipase RssA
VPETPHEPDPTPFARVLLDELAQVALRRQEPPWEVLSAAGAERDLDSWRSEGERALVKAEERALERFHEQTLQEGLRQARTAADQVGEEERRALLSATPGQKAELTPEQQENLRTTVEQARARLEERARQEARAKRDREERRRRRDAAARLREEDERNATRAEVKNTPAPPGSDAEVRQEEKARAHARDMELTGLALSGGGIRSATFCLGVLQGLAALGLLRRFDYLSTVSGGGYIGSWLAAWIKREGSLPAVERQLRSSRVEQAEERLLQPQPVEEEPAPIFHLRTYSNYLAPRLGIGSADSWVLLSIYVRNFLLNQLVLLPALLAALLLPRLAMLFYDWDSSPPERWTVAGLTCVAVILASVFILVAVSRLRKAGSAESDLPGQPVRQSGLPTLKWLVVLPLILASFLVCRFAWGSLELSGASDGAAAQLVPDGSEPNDAQAPTSKQKVIKKLAQIAKKIQKDVRDTLRKWLTQEKEVSARTDAASNPTVGLALTFGAVGAVVFFALHIVFALVVYGGHRRPAGTDDRELLSYPIWWVVSGALSGFAGPALLGVLLGVASQRMQLAANLPIAVQAAEVAVMVTIGPPLALLSFAVGAILQVGLMGRFLAEAEREWWASLCAYVLRTAAAWAVFCGLALFGVPLLILAGTAVQALAGAAWIGTALGGVLAARSPRTGTGNQSRSAELLALAAPYVFLLGLTVALSWGLSHWLDRRPPESAVVPFTALKRTPEEPPTHVTEAPPAGSSTRSLEYTEQHDEQQIQLWRYWSGLFNTNGTEDNVDLKKKNSSQLLVKLGLAFIAFVFVALLASWLVGVNTFSLHGLYGNRLIRCYLGASRPRQTVPGERPAAAPTGCGPPPRRPNPVTGFDPNDDLPLHDLRVEMPLPARVVAMRPARARPYRGPYLLLNTALNLVHGDELAYQERMAEAFLMSPLYCGSKSTRYRPLPEYGGGLRLGTAVTVSGAAASPNMGYHSSPAVTALLTTFNVRLGGWYGNPGQWTWRHGEPRMALFLLFKELFGRTDRHSDYVYLSDGGHFENLGVYELVRRHCRFIVACDADQDGDYTFDDLGGLIRKCRSDLGVPIEIDATPIKPQGTGGRNLWHCTVGAIRYDALDPRAVPGLLLYLKTSLTGDEPPDVLNYAAEHPTFPHQPTANQFFTESQFESYRALGEHTARAVFTAAMHDVEDTADMTDAAHRRVVRRLFANLRRSWFPPPPQLEENFLDSAKAYAELEADVRRDPNLRDFSLSLYPELAQALASSGQSSNEEIDRSRAELHAVDQLLQAMENAWLAVHLEGYHAHPLNRGWMIAFHRWANSAVLRRHWLTVRGEFSRDFVRFCEQELRLDPGSPRAYAFDPACLRGEESWPALRLEFQQEWPRERPLDELIGEVENLGARLHGHCPVWLVAPVPIADPTPDVWTPARYPAGVVLVWEPPDTATDYEVLVWLRGAYRNLGLGRECLNDLLPQIADLLLGADGQRTHLRVRLPGAARTGAADKLQRDRWLAFFFEFGFRKEPGAADLILRRPLDPTHF